MTRTLLLLLFLLTHPAMAQQIPGHFRVAGVAADDVLNVRSDPRASAKIVGIFGPTSDYIEVVQLSESGGWGRVNFDGGPGWVSMRFLEPMTEQDRFSYLDTPLWCGGTEPFWGLSIRDEQAVLSGIEPDEQSFAITFKGGPVGFQPGGGTLIARLGAARLVATVGQRQCDDGMSDQVYGLSVDVLTESPSGYTVLSGCCQLDR